MVLNQSVQQGVQGLGRALSSKLWNVEEGLEGELGTTQDAEIANEGDEEVFRAFDAGVAEV